MKYLDAINRLFSRLDLNGECWEYRGARTRGGYGRMSYTGRCHDTHRIAYIEFIDQIPDGMIVAHSCDNPPCFNPDHLFLGTQADNMRDMNQKMRRASGEPLSDAIKAGWTTEKRLVRSKQMSDTRRQQYRQRQIAAGVPFNWKYCAKSEHWLPLGRFGKNAARSDGTNSYCNDCRYLTRRAKY